VGQNSVNFLKDTLVDKKLLKFFFNVLSEKKVIFLPLLRDITTKLLLKTTPVRILSIAGDAPMNLVRNTFH